MAFLLGFAVNGFAQADGLYYLYEVSNKQFLTHGEDWGTRACLDFYGSPVTWNSTEGSLKFKDNNLCLFKTGDNFYTDNNSTGFKFVETEGGYYLQTADGASYAKLVDGAHLKCLMPTGNVAEAVVWQLKTKAERDAMVTDYVNQNYVNVINAAGLDITANDFLTELAKYTAVDKTSAIGTARFAGNVGDWTYVKGRDQGGQPAYGTDFCEIWQGTGRHTKTINGLTPGIYKVTVQGFERASGWAKCNELAAEGLEISTTTFTANGQHVAFKSWFSGKSDEKNPNNTGEAVAKFNEGKYQNEVYAYVGEDGILNLMVDKHAHVGDNWVLFNNFTLTYYEAPAAPAVPVWKDIKVDFTNNQILTEAETNIISVGIKMNEDGTATRVAADDASANAVVTGKWHSTDHGLANFSATVKVEGPVKIGMGSCAWGGNVTVKDENGVEVANAFNTNNGACWATKDGADKNVIYTYYKGEAATLTIAGGSYTPYFSVEKIALEDIPTVMKVNYSLGETGAAGILPANFELDGGKTFTLPVNRTLYVEGKTLTG
ncbi:MAG: hypothetical protein J6Q93_05865 [Prevotella sp.]|nr:hypothetical protein [Prevotella sp.]